MEKINGYITAPFTPMNDDYSLNLDMIKPYSEMVVRNGLDGVFTCGTSGEGFSLTTAERKSVLEEWVAQSPDGFKVIAHVGATGIHDSIELAKHAGDSGAWGIGVINPVFFKPKNIDDLVAYCSVIAGAVPDLPFYFYHIPRFTGDSYSMVEFLIKADKKIPNLGGIKYTYENMYEFNQCMKVSNGKFEMLHGQDETLLHGLQLGAKSGVGGTYNHCFPVYRELIKAYNRGDYQRALELQNSSQEFINVLVRYGGNVIGGKRMMKFLDMDCGPSRLPINSLSATDEQNMKSDLNRIGFFDYCNK
ncbi:MAG: dihydrodipicolinate synthase family protein [Bacteroidales bacterium]|nr:dihydrodipicolinate synthase family protein [Bacteroidales bacterium]